MTLKFSKRVGAMQFPNAHQLFADQRNRVFCLKNQEYNADLQAGSRLQMEFIGQKAINNEAAPSATLELHPGRNSKCDMSLPPSVIPPEATPPVQETSIAELIEEWPNGFKMSINILMQQKVEGGWKMMLRFPIRVESLQTPQAHQRWISQDRKVYILENQPHNAFLEKCSRFEMIIIGTKKMYSDAPSEAAIEFRRKENWNGGDEGGCVPSTTQPPITTESTTTTEPPITTELPTTTELPATTEPPVTTEPPTATETPTTTEPPITTEPPTTTESPTTNEPPTITEPPTTTEPSTSTESPTTTEPLTTTEPESTTEPPTTTEPPSTTEAQPTTSRPSSKPPKYDYDSVLHDSILFYEAQRSGKLPNSNRVPWRKDSALNDRGQNGEDLSGGWYDAGDYVKFGFPMAFSVTMLSWGLVQYGDAYEDAGELNYMLDCIKWPLDYFMKAHIKQEEFYGQVGL